ncbi:PadR family transcriptional regulator [Clostridiales bacterium PH28_bin88]|nr:PadR family transcriptional regulator [Clostridiales bacterium PH28_bin88]
MEKRIIRDLFLGFMKVHLLHHAAQEAIYGTQMIEELGRHGYEVGPGTLYPVLHYMEKQGLLQSYERVVEGKVRRYYTATEAGKRLLREARKRAKELVDEIWEVEEGGKL